MKHVFFHAFSFQDITGYELRIVSWSTGRSNCKIHYPKSYTIPGLRLGMDDWRSLL